LAKHSKNISEGSETWGFHSDEGSSHGLRVYDNLYSCDRIPVFRRTMLSPSSLHSVTKQKAAT